MEWCGTIEVMLQIMGCAGARTAVTAVPKTLLVVTSQVDKTLRDQATLERSVQPLIECSLFLREECTFAVSCTVIMFC